MTGFFDLKSPNFLGGSNVHFLVLLTGVGFLTYKALRK